MTGTAAWRSTIADALKDAFEPDVVVYAYNRPTIQMPCILVAADRGERDEDFDDTCRRYFTATLLVRGDDWESAQAFLDDQGDLLWDTIDGWDFSQVEEKARESLGTWGDPGVAAYGVVVTFSVFE